MINSVLKKIIISIIGSIFTFTSAYSAEDLLLQGVEVTGKYLLTVEFSSTISEEKESDFVLKDVFLSEEIEILNTKILGNKVEIESKTEFLSKQKYEIIIISLYGEDGSTITSGVQGALKFTAPDDMTKFEKSTVEQGTIDIKGENSEVGGLNSANSDKETSKNESQANESQVLGNQDNNENLGGKEVSEDAMNSNIGVAAGKTENLPTTGPEHIFFLMLALLLGGGIMFMIPKKNKL